MITYPDKPAVDLTYCGKGGIVPIKSYSLNFKNTATPLYSMGDASPKCFVKGKPEVYATIEYEDPYEADLMGYPKEIPGGYITQVTLSTSDGSLPLVDEEMPISTIPKAMSEGQTLTRYFEFVGGSSSKFWEITICGTKVTTRYGRIGTDGQTDERTEDNTWAASVYVNKKVKEKLGKGYKEGKWVTPGAGSPEVQKTLDAVFPHYSMEIKHKTLLPEKEEVKPKKKEVLLDTPNKRKIVFED